GARRQPTGHAAEGARPAGAHSRCRRRCPPGTPPPAPGSRRRGDRSTARHLGHRGGRRPQRSAPHRQGRPDRAPDRPPHSGVPKRSTASRRRPQVSPATDMPATGEATDKEAAARRPRRIMISEAALQTLLLFGFLVLIAVYFTWQDSEF